MVSPTESLYSSYLSWCDSGDESSFTSVYRGLDYIFDRVIDRILTNSGLGKDLVVCADDISHTLTYDEIDRLKLKAWEVFVRKHDEIRMDKCEAYFDRVIRGEYSHIRRSKNRKIATGNMLNKVEYEDYIKYNDIGVVMGIEGSDTDAKAMFKLQSKINDADNSLWKLLSFTDKSGGVCECSLCGDKRDFGQLRVLWSGLVKCKGCVEKKRKALMYESRGGEMKWFPVTELGIRVAMPVNAVDRLLKSKRLLIKPDDKDHIYLRGKAVSIGLLVLFKILHYDFHKRSSGSMLNLLGIAPGHKKYSLLAANFQTYRSFISMVDHSIVAGTSRFRKECRWIKKSSTTPAGMKPFIDRVNVEVK